MRDDRFARVITRCSRDEVVLERTTFAAGTTLEDDAVQRCVAANIHRLKFPARGGTANVKYPFIFTQG